MRKANMKDLFKFARLINKLKLKDDIFEAQKGSDDAEKIGFDLIFNIFEKATKVESEKDIYDICSAPFEMTAQEVSEMDANEFFEAFMKCFDISSILNFIVRARN